RDALNGKFLVAGAEKRLAGPFAALIVVLRVEIIIARDQRAAHQRLAGPGRKIPPAFRGPVIAVLVAERDPDPAISAIADAEIGKRGARREKQHGKRKRS